MKIRYLKRSQIDAQKWNVTIENSPQGRPFAYTWHLDVVCIRWGALVGDDYEAVMPLPYNLKWAGIPQVYQPLFSQQLGVFAKNDLTEDQVRAFVQAIPLRFRKMFLQFHSQTPFPKHIPHHTATNFELDLHRPYETIRSCYHKKLRQTLRKAAAHLLAEDALCPSAFLDYYRQYLHHKINLSPTEQTSLQHLIQAYLSHQKGQIVGAIHSVHGLVCCGFIIKSHRRIFTVLVVNTPIGRQLKSKHWLLDQLVRQHAGTSWKLDSMGSELPGVSVFMKSFGQSNRPYFRYAVSKFPVSFWKTRNS